MSSIGVKSGVLNTEFRISKSGKVNFIEVNSRHSGNFIYQLMNRAYGLSMEDIAIRLALGEKLDIERLEPNGYFAYAIMYSEASGNFSDIEMSKEIDPYIIKKYIFKEKGEQVNVFSKLADRIGIVLLQFPTYEEMLKVIGDFRSYYKVNLL